MATEVSADAPALRAGRRERALAQMDAHNLDILVLGRQANIRYVTGAPQLWIAGTRPFGPMCVVVRATGDIYLNSTDDEGVPEEIGHDHLYGLAWNPMTLIDVLKKIDGAEAARRVGTDALTPTFAALLPDAFPRAELVDAELAMRAARRVKTADEIAAIGEALRVAETGLAAAVGELRPGVSERTLTGALLGAMAAGGVSTPATQDGAWVTSREHPWRRAAAHTEVRSGDLVAFAAGALAGGYVAEVGGTRPAGGIDDGPVRDLFDRSKALYDNMIAACGPGASTHELLAAYAAAGEPVPPMPVGHGLGLGFDPPVVSETLWAAGEHDQLAAGMVLAITGYVWQEGVGAVFRRDTVAITADGADVLTTAVPWLDGS
ncbi:Xaa-Pro aminopeptidase [Mycobacterium sp. IS-836]|uniref:M24 family metallopeptidase n=1 Tax=Mycobacterium sp. IS-836 TaxID=1834160 RepID=UPI00096FF341|nr:M24 family metallopeptidase [Mycobacterium sp. IS-836]OMC56442.1 Xaa-Pro aminopeptidase [Mycobacterium sp. IS-836]